MRIAVLASPESWYVRDLQRASAGRDELVVLPFSGIRSELNDEGERVCCGGITLTDFDVILVRTMPPGSLEQVVFRMDALGRCEAKGVVVLNPARAVEAAVDKYLASAKLLAAGLRTPRTIVCQNVDDAMQAFERLGQDVVVKPLFGSEGRGITRVTDADVAFRAVKLLAQLGAVFYLQEFLPHHGEDLRLFVLGNQVLGMKRQNLRDWRTNVSRGATAAALAVSDELAEIARQAADAVGAVIAGIDILPARNGNSYVLEVNAVPGWRALARTLDIDIARQILDFAHGLVRKGSTHRS
jgi:ribosomal protein S6--L-glutamate ligase